MSHEGIKLLLADTITPAELKKYQTQYTHAMGQPGGATPKERFEYAIAMTRSRYSADQMRAVNILEDLCVSGDPNAFRDYLYFIAIANTKLGVNFDYNSIVFSVISNFSLFDHSTELCSSERVRRKVP